MIYMHIRLNIHISLPTLLSYITSNSMASDLIIKQRTCNPNGLNICKYLVICTIFVYVVYIFLSSHPCCQSQEKWGKANMNGVTSATNLSHLVFGIAASTNTWGNKRLYAQAWWRPNVTRGYMFLDRAPTEHLPWPSTYPPFRVSEDNSRYREYNKHRIPFAIRMVRVIEETFKAERDGGKVRWYVMADDDTVLLVDNLVTVLSKYDHNKYYYIGMNSESIISNVYHSFGMAFGGGGYALSFPLAKALVQNMDLCLQRYPTLHGSDHILQSCIADLGVSLTQEKGFHQIDFRGDISGFLSAHPRSPLISLHHLDAVDPIFPSKNRTESLKLLMEAASVDESRLLQQSVCYLKKYNWTISAAWGYSVQIYDTVLPPSYLHRPLETFGQWLKGASPPYMFNARALSDHPCHAPHLFFFDSVVRERVTNYTRRPPPANCSSHSDHNVTTIRIVLPSKKLNWHKGGGGRRECCDVVQPVGVDSLEVKLRDCASDEIVA